MVKTQAVLVAMLLIGAAGFAADVRVGLIGCDTSHAVAFTETWNNPQAKGHVPGFKVVAAYRGGSADIEHSVKLQEEIVPKLREKYGVKFYDSIEELCTNVDVICLESLDGRPKLAQLKPVIAAHKPVYVDKPMATTVAEVAEMFRLANEARVPIFTCSSLRFAKNTQAVRAGAIGVVTNAQTFGPCETEAHHPELYWYGIHGVEALFTVMGTGCVSVQRGTNAQGKVEVVGIWPGGRKGVFTEDKDFHGQANGERGVMAVGAWDGYVPLVEEISRFFKSGVSPVRQEETIELFAFMAAAEQSKKLGGKPVEVKPLISKLKN